MLRRDAAAFRRPLRLIFLASLLGLVFQVWTAWRGCLQSSAFVPAGGRGEADRPPRPVGLRASESKEGSDSAWPQIDLESEGEELWKVVTVFNAACWGSSYISSKAGIDALTAAGVEDASIVFGALRFGLAALPLLPWVLRSSAAESARTSAIVGSLNGLSYAAIFTSYAYGTTGGKAAFITSLQTIVVAACTSLATQRLQVGTVVSAIMAVVGVGFLELAGGPMETTAGNFAAIQCLCCVLADLDALPQCAAPTAGCLLWKLEVTSSVPSLQLPLDLDGIFWAVR